VNLHLDGEFAFGLARITAAWLKVGDVLSDEKIAQLLQAEDAQENGVTTGHALPELPRTFREGNTAKPAKARIPEDAIEETIERPSRKWLANDNEFARYGWKIATPSARAVAVC
jgi:regulatory protein